MAFELTEAQMQGFADYKASYLPSQVSAGPTFRTAIAEHVSSLAQLAEPEICARRKAFIKSELAEDAFRERVLLKDGARIVVGGIRFQNLNPEFPFVEINGNFDLFTPERMQHLASVARQQFGGFAPKGILITGPPDVEPSTGVERWTHTVGGPTAAACNAPLPLELTSSFPASVDFYDQYHAAYTEWQAVSPGLSSFVRPEPREDLEASAVGRLLASFTDAAGWSGLVAAREESFYGTPALHIFEIFLVERWRGRGAATAMEAALVSSLAGRYGFVWENIHSQNRPSLRVALAHGRSVLETEYFFPYDDNGRLRIGPE